jgi:AcrR family transcriptional regulator
MSPQVRTTPRKRPRQDRARTTVEAILEATARLLVQRGFDQLTTNAVAEQAGVSIGSLYQYFPNKEALVADLIERHVEERRATMAAELGRVATLPAREATRLMIDSIMAAHRVNPELHRVLIEQVPRIGRLARLQELAQKTRDLLASILAARRKELAIDDPALAAFVLQSAIEGIFQRAVVYHPERMQDPRLREEVTRLVTSYLGV